MQNDLLSTLVHYGYTLLLTIIIEEVVAIFFFRKERIGYLLVLLVNVVTNPAINLFYTLINLYNKIPPYATAVILMELFVIWVEYRLIAHALNSRNKWWLIFSIAANAASYITGLVLL